MNLLIVKLACNNLNVALRMNVEVTNGLKSSCNRGSFDEVSKRLCFHSYATNSELELLSTTSFE